METTDLFAIDTAIERVTGNEFAATLTDRWGALGGMPNGGYLLAICGRALAETLPQPDPIAASAFYVRRAVPGPAQITTETVKLGRRLATGEARMFQDGKETLRVVSSFGDLAATEGRTAMLNSAPSLPPPEHCLDLMARGGIPGVTIAERCDYRAPKMPGWADGEPSGDPSLEFWMRLKGHDEHDPLTILTLVDAAAPAVLELGEFASATVELSVHVRARPAPGWLACRSYTRYVIDGYHEEDFEIWDEAGNLVAQSRQLALLA
jgi:acyl-CoA thioesterase